MRPSKLWSCPSTAVRRGRGLAILFAEWRSSAAHAVAGGAGKADAKAQRFQILQQPGLLQVQLTAWSRGRARP